MVCGADQQVGSVNTESLPRVTGGEVVSTADWQQGSVTAVGCVQPECRRKRVTAQYGVGQCYRL